MLRDGSRVDRQFAGLWDDVALRSTVNDRWGDGRRAEVWMLSRPEFGPHRGQLTDETRTVLDRVCAKLWSARVRAPAPERYPEGDGTLVSANNPHLGRLRHHRILRVGMRDLLVLDKPRNPIVPHLFPGRRHEDEPTQELLSPDGFERFHKRRYSRLHVRRSPPIDASVSDPSFECRGGPVLGIARRHHVDMSGGQ